MIKKIKDIQSLKKLLGRSILMFTICIFISGCYGPRKVNSWVSDKYGTTLNSKVKIKDDYLSISSRLITKDPAASSTVKKTKHVLPLLFYWKLDYMNTCTLNPKIPINTFIATFQSYANSKGLKSKLNGQKIAITIEKMPNVFVINDKAQIVWVIYAFGWDIFSITPESSDMVVSYRILKDNSEIKKGVITTTDANKAMTHLRFVKSGTLEYFAQYDENIKAMTKKVAEKIMAEL